MFDFVRDMIAEGDSWQIRTIISEMEGLIRQAEERLKEMNNKKDRDTDEYEGEDEDE